MTRYPHLAARVFNVPLLVHPGKLDAILAGLGPRLLGLSGQDVQFAAHLAHAAREDLGADAGLTPEFFSTRRGERAQNTGWPGYRVVDGVAVVSASGALVHRTRLEGMSDILLGYNDLAASIEHAQDNTDVHAILQVWDSPGGEAQGAFEFADRMHAMRGRKPMIAIADGLAASAAYLGGSAADEMVVTTTGYAGSIGVVMRHVDLSRALANEGINVTHIFAGDHKVDGNQFEALSADVRADLQAEIDELYAMFVGAVVRQTGLSEEAVRNTQARTYRGVAAVAAGLASRVGTTDALISELAAQRSSRAYGLPAQATATTTGDTHMAGTQATAGATAAPANPAAAAAAPAAGALTQADLDRARAEGHAAGVEAERARASAILTHSEAVGREALAQQCVATGLTADQAGAVLAAAPKAAANGNDFAAAMSRVNNPAVQGRESEGDPALQEQQAIEAGWARGFGYQAAGR